MEFILVFLYIFPFPLPQYLVEYRACRVPQANSSLLIPYIQKRRYVVQTAAAKPAGHNTAVYISRMKRGWCPPALIMSCAA